MGRKNLPGYNRELNELIAQYEAAKAEGQHLYMDADQLADIADLYASEQRFKEAQEVIDYGLHLHAGNTDLLVEQAYLYLDTQKIHLAKEITASITEEFNTDVKMLKAELFLNEGQLESARHILNTIEEPDEMENIINVVYLFLDMGYPEEAGVWLEKGKSRYSEEEDFIAVNADYLASTNQIKLAALYYDRLIDIDPYNPAYWIGLAKCHFVEEDSEKAIEACDFALAADETFGEAYAYRAHSYFYLNNSEAAIADYKKAMEYKALAPEMGNMFLGMAYSNKEEWVEANKHYQLVIQAFVDKKEGNSPLLIDTYTNAAIANAQLGNFAEAHLLCEKAKAINPKESIIYLTDGKVYLKENLPKKALQAFKIALKEDDDVEMLYLIGCAYADVDMLKPAKRCFEKAYEIDPTYTDVPEKLSVLSLTENKIEDFFKYNSECASPINEDIILDLLTNHQHTKEGKKTLLEVLERMRKEKKK